MLPVIEAFMAAHRLPGVTVVADAGMISAVQAEHHLHGLFLEFRSVILSFRHFSPSPFREDLIDLPVRELGGTSTIHLAVAGGVHIGRADGLRRRALRLQERVGYPVAESQQAGSGQCYRHGAAPPDGVG
jgi:hypothetical protein